jgi:hypothetical protein
MQEMGPIGVGLWQNYDLRFLGGSKLLVVFEVQYLMVCIR